VAWLVIAKIVFNDLQDVVVINPYVNDVSLILIIMFYFVMIDTGADVKIMDRFFRYRKVPLPRKIFKTRISA